MTLTDIRNLWVEELRTRGMSERTLDSYIDHTDEWIASFATTHRLDHKNQVRLDHMTRDAIVTGLANYRTRPDKRTGKPAIRAATSVVTHYTAMRAFANWCTYTGRIATNPVSRHSMRPPRTGKRVPKALSPEACQALITACGNSRWPTRDRFIIRLGLSMGLRLSEIAGIDMLDFSPSVYNPEHLTVHGKGDKDRQLPIPHVVAEALHEYLPDRDRKVVTPTSHLLMSSRSTELTHWAVGAVFDAACRRAGVKAVGIRAHVTRHSFATHMLASNAANLVELQELMGHASVATTQGYVRVTPQRLAASMESNPLNTLAG